MRCLPRFLGWLIFSVILLWVIIHSSNLPGMDEWFYDWVYLWGYYILVFSICSMVGVVSWKGYAWAVTKTMLIPPLALALYNYAMEFYTHMQGEMHIGCGCDHAIFLVLLKWTVVASVVSAIIGVIGRMIYLCLERKITSKGSIDCRI